MSAHIVSEVLRSCQCLDSCVVPAKAVSGGEWARTFTKSWPSSVSITMPASLLKQASKRQYGD